MDMQREGEENPEHFLPSGKARHKPGKKTTGVQGKVIGGKGRGRKKGIGGKDKVTPTFDELLEKLNRAKRIERGEQVVEPSSCTCTTTSVSWNACSWAGS